MAFTGTPGNAQGKSGAVKPNFLPVQSANLHDPAGQDSPPAVKWYWMFPPSHNYPAFLGNDTANTCVIEPTNLPAPANQTVYLQISNGGTSASSGTAPSFRTNPGDQTSDGDLIWLCLGSATWAATTNVTPWTAKGQVFSAIKDSNGNMQVCTSSVKTGTTQPLQAYQAGHAYSNGNTIVDANGNKQTVTSPGTSSVSKTLTTSDITSGVATYTTSTNHGYAVGQQVTITSSSHNAAFNVVNAIITSIPTAATVRPVPACVTRPSLLRQ